MMTAVHSMDQGEKLIPFSTVWEDEEGTVHDDVCVLSNPDRTSEVEGSVERELWDHATKERRKSGVLQPPSPPPSPLGPFTFNLSSGGLRGGRVSGLGGRRVVGLKGWGPEGWEVQNFAL